MAGNGGKPPEKRGAGPLLNAFATTKPLLAPGKAAGATSLPSAKRFEADGEAPLPRTDVSFMLLDLAPVKRGADSSGPSAEDAEDLFDDDDDEGADVDASSSGHTLRLYGRTDRDESVCVTVRDFVATM